tara:strand:- start:276 stop:539 length:264 start_codon:yes stop_codon:yes gene_type:complete
MDDVGFVKTFGTQIRSVCDVAKSLDFQGRRNLIFFQNLCSLDKFHKGIRNSLEGVYVGTYRQLSAISKGVPIRSTYALPVFRCPEKQ